MKTYDIFIFGLNSLTQRKLRSWLTILGIIIGIASVVSLISIGEGAQEQIKNQLSGFGADIVSITPGHERAGGPRGFGEFGGFGGSRRGNNLTESDVNIAKATQSILYINGIVSGRAEISYLGESGNANIQGVDTSVWHLMETTGLESGRYLSPGDSNVVVIGNRIANQMFKQQVVINRQITVGDKVFKVVGILQSAGTFGQQDSAIYMPKEIARQILEIDIKQVSSITIKVADSSQVQNVADQIESKLRISRHVQETNQDFTVSTAQAIQTQISDVTGTFTLFLAVVAGISLLVGAIGISNTMFTSVMERTKQIGILKSLGATDGEIMKIFVTESSLIGLFGGVLGVLFGVIASGILSELSLRIGFQGAFNTAVSPSLVLLSIFFSIIIGTLSGLLPAKRAANLQPVEALRYE